MTTTAAAAEKGGNRWIPRIRSLLTVIGGEIKHDAGFFGKHKGHKDDDDDDDD
jgi:hypothetical protein